MSKKTFSQAHIPKPKTLTPDEIDRFIEQGRGNDALQPAKSKEPEEDSARLAVMIPESLHTRFKIACATHRTTMAQEVRLFVEKRTSELEIGKTKS